MAEKSFKPPLDVARAAALGLALRRSFDRGGTAVGVARARDLANRRQISVDTLRRMRSYFQRHAVDAEAAGSPSRGFWGRKSNPSAGWVAWLLWGGNPGRDWANATLREVEQLTKEGGAEMPFIDQTTARKLRVLLRDVKGVMRDLELIMRRVKVLRRLTERRRLIIN